MRVRKLILAARMASWIVVLSTVGRALSLPAILRLTDTRHRGAARFRAEELASVIDRVFRTDLLHRSCWKRAAVLRRFLLLEGIETAVVFGVRQGEETLAGHAWLERDGKPFLEGKEPDYVVTFRYPS